MKSLTSVDELESVIAGTAEEPVLIYKHSNICSIAARALLRLEQYLESEDELPEVYQIDVIASRPVSNAVQSRLGVTHESPQLILVQGGKAVWDTSHGGIRADKIEAALAELAAG